MFRISVLRAAALILVCLVAAFSASAQKITKTYEVSTDARVEVVNLSGKVEAIAEAAPEPESNAPASPSGTPRLNVVIESSGPVGEDDLKIDYSTGHVRIESRPRDTKKRIDIYISMPAQLKLSVETDEGEVRFSGPFRSVDVRTVTGTIAGAFPTGEVRYSLLWTASKPRFLSDFELEKVKERSGGKFSISGTYRDRVDSIKDINKSSSVSESDQQNADVKTAAEEENGGRSGLSNESKKTADRNRSIRLDLQSARGIIILNIPPNEVTSDLRERPLTKAAQAIIRSGDSLLMEAIRRAAPKFFGDYMRTLPPLKLEPKFADQRISESERGAGTRIAIVTVSDANNRAISGLNINDFEVLENSVEREVLGVSKSAAPFNLVLLLDVSGSVDNYVDFIRKAARTFVNTVDPKDRVSIITFNEDVNVLAKFTTDKSFLSKSLDTFDAGGATAYYDALAFTIADTLRPLKGERTAVVILTDGDDNRSFLPFDSMLASIQESGALIYPLYVPSGLIAASQTEEADPLDRLRSRYLQGELTSKADEEGKRLANVSGGVYYSISRLSQIGTAYEDIVRQLRTAYEVEYRSNLAAIGSGISPRLKIRIKRPNAFVQVRTVSRKSH